MWLKCSNNNKGIDAHESFKECINKFVTPLQVRCNKGLENRLITKYIAMLRSTHFKGHIGGRSRHNTRIECFWREHNVNVMIHFRKVLETL